jgi:hypothetical protein
MRAKVKTWTAQETELAEALLAEKATNEMCLAALGRTKRCCESRIGRIKNPYGSIKASGNYVMDARIEIPPEVFEERNKRLMARYQMDLTGQLCGDPIPGFSMLEKRA